MKTVNLMTQQVVSRRVERKVIIGHVLSRKIGVRACSALILVATATPAVFADGDIYRYVSPNGNVYMTNVPNDRKFAPITEKRHYHASVSDQELEEAVARYAQEYRLSPALLMAVIKAESDFNPIVISKAGAVGLMQLIPETAIRHGVRNLYDTSENIAGGARHLRYLLDRFHDNIRLALAAYNAGERKVDRYRQIPPFKETRIYVKKVMGFYRDYRTSQAISLSEREGSPTFVR
jgi:soluble lytic murein transglycosylase-like protein